MTAPARLLARPLLALGLALSVSLALGQLGCGERSVQPVESAPCERIGDSCRLPDGPMGVCNVTTAPCDDPPCLACISQH